MTSDVVYLYPKSSCPTENCSRNYLMEKGPKSNLSINGCSYSPYFDCYNKVEINRSIQPTKTKGSYTINPQAYNNKLAEGFDEIKCGSGCKIAPSCLDTFYLSRDPRQYDAVRGDYTALDAIPIDGNVKLKDVYKVPDNYGIGFRPYEDIESGQIIYYIDKSIKDPFYTPVFSEPAESKANLFKDPMGAMKPEYNRVALINTENPTVTTAMNYPYKLSYLQDTQSFREDIMALQQRKNNQEKWSARWA